MALTLPIVTPRVTPAKMRAIKGGEDFVAMRLVVVCAEPREAVVKTDVPWIAKTARKNFQIFAIPITTQNATLAPPVIGGVMIIFLVIRCVKNLRRWKIRCVRRLHAPQLSKRPRRHAVGQLC